MIQTYSLADRALAPEFAIHDERRASRVAQPHRHDYFQMQLNLAGDAVQHVGATTRPLPAGGLSFVLPYRVHRVERPQGSRFFVLNFELSFLRPELDIDPLDLDELPLERAPELAPFLYQEFMDFRLSGKTLEAARSTCARMQAESSGTNACARVVIRAELLLLLAAVCRSHDAAIERLRKTHPQAKSRRDALSRVARFCRENLDRRITLSDAAAAAQLSPNYLAHLLKKETGKSFLDLLTERRMEKARELLTHTDSRIAEVARAVGFEDEAYFARRFRQCVGQSPRAYRLAQDATGAARNSK